MRRKFAVLLTAALVSAVSPLVPTCIADAKAPSKPAPKKEWTVTDRQVELNKEIDAGEKASELTAMEAAKLREKSGKVTVRIDKMKAKNGGKLSYEDNNKIEADLNKLSLAIQKDKLNKRVRK